MTLARLTRSALVLGLCTLLCSCSAPSPKAPKPSPSASASVAVAVETVTARSATLPENITAVGTFEAVTSVNISPKIAGLVVEVPVHTGQFVPQGAVIMQLDTSDLEMTLRQSRADLMAEQTRLGLTRPDQQLRSDRDVPSVRKARASLENARLAFERSSNLYRADLIAQKDLQDDKTALISAQADYQTALESVQTSKANVLIKRTQVTADEMRLNNATVRAPFSGYVASVGVDVGDYVTPSGSSGNSPYVALLTLDPIYCEVKIGESNSQKVRVGQAVEVTTVAYPGRTFKGSVLRISPALDTSTRTLRVNARIANPEKLLKPGLYGNVLVTLGVTPGVTMVAQMAQTEKDGQTCVYTVESTSSGTVARLRTMRRGRIDGRWIEARESTLKPGEAVIVGDLDRLHDGAPITVSKTLQEAPPVLQASP